MKIKKNIKKISLFGTVSIGIGGMVGGGIFAVLGEAVSLAHGATPIAFLVAGIIAFLTAYSYAKLTTTFQSRGGTVTFIDNAFGQNLLSGSINFMLWLSYIVTISLYAVAFASYGSTFFSAKTELLNHILISVAIILPAIINIISASFVSKSESIIVAIKIILLIIVIISGVFFIDTSRLSPINYGSDFSIINAGMIIFVAYEGFELIANASERVEDPLNNIPKAFYLSVSIVIILYILISIVTVGTVDETALLEAKDYALALAAKPALGQIGFSLVAVAALLSTFSAINATIFGNARLGYIIAKDGELPTLFEYEKGKIPIMGVFLTVICSLTLANSINLNDIAIIASAGFLLIFFIVNISALKLSNKIGANKFIVLVSSALSLMALVTLMIKTYNTDIKAVVIFVTFIIISFLFELFYGKIIRGHLFRKNY